VLADLALFPQATARSLRAAGCGSDGAPGLTCAVVIVNVGRGDLVLPEGGVLRVTRRLLDLEGRIVAQATADLVLEDSVRFRADASSARRFERHGTAGLSAGWSVVGPGDALGACLPLTDIAEGGHAYVVEVTVETLPPVAAAGGAPNVIRLPVAIARRRPDPTRPAMPSAPPTRAQPSATTARLTTPL
jgi:hypothetical protein